MYHIMGSESNDKFLIFIGPVPAFLHKLTIVSFLVKAPKSLMVFMINSFQCKREFLISLS